MSNLLQTIAQTLANQFKAQNTQIATAQANASTTALTTIRDGVDAAGDTLAKQYVLIQALQSLVQSSDVDLDTVQEIVAYIKANRNLIDSVTTNKVDKTAIVDGLTSTDATKVLAASQGKVLNDALTALTTTVAAKAVAADVGTVSLLTTTNKTVVGAINELAAATTNIGTASEFETAFNAAMAA